MDEPEEVPFHPPDAVTVARRALILCGVVCRSNLEYYTDETYRRQTAADVSAWLTDLDLWPYVEPDEDKIFCTPFGKLPPSLSAQGTWFVEGLAILAWALHRGDFPPHDEKVDAVDVTNTLDFLSPDAEDLLACPTLRDASELEAAREWFYDAHCTLRGYLNHCGHGRLAADTGDHLKILGVETSAVMVKGYLAFKGRPVSRIKRAELWEWEHVICERHRAAIWLVGEEPSYTELSVDT